MKTEIMVQAQRANDTEPQWFSLDLSKDNKITLQYVSNILSDVSKITTSHSMTVKLPRTAHNDEVLDLAVVPQYESRARYKYLPCRVIVNGIDVTGDAFLYLTDSEGDSYSCVIVFGLMQNFRAWLDSGKGLRDLQEHGEYIPWNDKCAVDCGSVWWSNYPSRYTSLLPSGSEHNLASQFYALYDCGVTRDASALSMLNLHPCVTLREIYERVVSENNLNFVVPTDVLIDMENVAIVQVERNQPESGQEHAVSVASGTTNDIFAADYGQIQSLLGGLCGKISFPTSEYYRNQYWLYKGEGYIRVEWDFYLRPYTGQNRVFGEIFRALHETYGNLDYVRLAIYDRTVGQMHTYTPTSYTYSGGVVSDVRFNGSLVFTNTDNIIEGGAIAEMVIWLDPQMTRIQGAIPYVGYYFQMQIPNNEIFTYSGYTQLNTYQNNSYFQYTYIEGTTPYPNQFQLIPNLPNIKQVDFIKAICQMYGLFPVVDQTDTERVDFVNFDILSDSIYKAYDWSGRLIEETKDAPNKIAFRLGDFAQRNILKYKDDENEKYPFDSQSALTVDDYTLEKEKVLIELPWAATKIDKITQYELIEETDESEPPTVSYKAEFTQCEYRIVRITEWQRQGDCANVAKFKDLDAEYILATYYNTYQGQIRTPIIITEHIRLNEVEIRDVDFRVPVYLGKYGRYYAIKNIKWTTDDSFAEVELLQIQ